MTTTERGTRRERRKGCYAVAVQRARMTRRCGHGRLVALLICLWALMSGPFRSRTVASLPAGGPFFPPSPSGSAESEDWSVTDYERGIGGHLIRPRPAASGTGRYRSRPSLTKLMADLRRPAARKDAAAALEARIADPVIRAWVAARIDKDEINRLSIWVQPGRSETNVIAAWRGEANAALDEAASNTASPSPDRGSLLDVAKLLESLAGAETVTSSGPKPPGDI